MSLLKKTTLTALLLLLISGTLSVTAQDCTTGFYPFKTGAEMELSHSDKKGKITSVSTTKITSVTPTADGFVIGMDIRAKDDKGKETINSSSTTECHNGVYHFKFSDLFSNMMNTTSVEGMEMVMSGDDITMPSNVSVGQTFPDASSSIQMRMNGMSLMTFNFTTRNRKVEAKESVTTPAGTFDCYKMTYDLDTKIMGARTSKVSSWWAIGTGLVRQESFNTKGELEGKTELTKFKN